MHVVVVGGGVGGMATAARLAKLGHEVTLLERAPQLGGALGSLTVDEHVFDTGPTYTLLPAVVRDLFRKSGRPLERELELVPVPVIREHRFGDGTRVEVTGGSRAAQKRAFDALGPGLGEQWVAWVDRQGPVWERLRRDYLERPWDPALAHRDAVRLLRSRTSLHRSLRGAFSDPRLRLVGGHPAAEDGHDLRRVPAWLGTVAYVEQKFGAWTVPDGLGRLAEVLTARLTTRKVDVRTGTEVTDLVLRAGRVVAVRTAEGDLEADAVVCAVDPHRLPSLAPYVRRTRSTTPGQVTYLGVVDEADAAWPGALVLHDPDRRGRAGAVVVRAGGRAPEGQRSLTVSHRLGDVDVVAELARRGLDLRDRVTVRVDRSSAELTEVWGGSPLGLQWHGRGTTAHRLGPRTPVAGLHAAGSYATPGSGIPFAGLTGSLVAQAIGPA